MDKEMITEVIDDIGDILYEIAPELTELIEEDNVSKGIINRLVKLKEDVQEIRECVYKEYYKEDELLET
jgi:hypothetical protein